MRHRLEALRSLVALVERHDLPVPSSVTFTDFGDGVHWLDVRLDDGQREGVAAWAGVLGLQLQPARVLTTDGKDWASVRAVRSHHDTPVWVDFHEVKVWASCDVELADLDVAA